MRQKGDSNARSSSRRPTPRQRQILELASLGLSDEQIAAQLSLSPRTIRFQLERLFRLLDVRSHDEAVTVLSDAQQPVRRPVDECPYPKPFPLHFAECPAYQARQVAALDDDSRPVTTVWTCRNLESTPIKGKEHRWYGACRVGDTIARRRWADAAGPERLHAINQILEELAPLTGPFARRLWELKAEQVRTMEANENPALTTRLLEALGRRFVDDLEGFLSRHRGVLEQFELAIDGCLTYARQLIDHVIQPGAPGDWDSRFDVLTRFPEDLWAESLATLGNFGTQAKRSWSG